LSQLINVLKGDMSLIEPRPHVRGMLAASLLHEQLIPYYFQRHVVRPGITGLAQMKGYRGSPARADLAIERIDHISSMSRPGPIWLDIRIIPRTIKREFIFQAAVNRDSRWA
jgi:lipopolysaccharide/colanic/teichoic acid biosynthesis glycosyltransferase